MGRKKSDNDPQRVRALEASDGSSVAIIYGHMIRKYRKREYDRMLAEAIAIIRRGKATP